jgi:hypothetical protein
MGKQCYSLAQTAIRSRGQRMNKRLLTFGLIIVASIPICCQKGLRPEERAIRLVEESRALGGELSVGHAIEAWLKAQGEDVRPIGWTATKKDDQVYLVGYKYKIFSFEKGSGERGFFFEVNLHTEAVQNVTERVTREMGSLAPPLKDREELPDQLLQKWVEEEKMLSGAEP